jgi:hypothetical protein
MSEEFKLSIDSLIKDELAGKASAIARYDEIIWKIRLGYAVLLYGTVGIIAGLVDKGSISALSAMILPVVGFSVFGACLDYSFVSAKIRVVNYRDRLVASACSRTSIGPGDSKQSKDLLECLKNSGERDEPVVWTNRAGRWVPLIYYGGIAAVCTSTIYLLIIK